MSSLAAYLADRKISEEAFGRAIGVSQAAVNRYKRGRVPEPPVMRRIISETEGKVTANDWYDIPLSDGADVPPRLADNPIIETGSAAQAADAA